MSSVAAHDVRGGLPGTSCATECNISPFLPANTVADVAHIQCTAPPPALDARTSMPCTSTQQQTAAGRDAASTSPAAIVLPRGVLTELLTSGVSVGAANTATNPLVRSRCQPASTYTHNQKALSLTVAPFQVELHNFLLDVNRDAAGGYERTIRLCHTLLIAFSCVLDEIGWMPEFWRLSKHPADSVYR
eukprot:scaffold52806_cov22-Tisochrysis_lutea.AAC.1